MIVNLAVTTFLSGENPSERIAEHPEVSSLDIAIFTHLPEFPEIESLIETAFEQWQVHQQTFFKGGGLSKRRLNVKTSVADPHTPVLPIGKASPKSKYQPPLHRHDPGATWVVASLGGARPLGTVVTPDGYISEMEDRGLTRIDGLVTPLFLLPPGVTAQEFISSQAQLMREFLEQLTPRPSPAPAASRPGATGLSAINPAVDTEGGYRILPIVRDGVGKRSRSIAEYTRSYVPHPLTDWILQGPRSMHFVLDFSLCQTNGAPSQRVTQFMTNAKRSFNDGNMVEFFLLGKIIEYAVTYDQLDVCNLASFELIARRFQLIEQKYRHRIASAAPLRASGEVDIDTSMYLGLRHSSGYGTGSICVMPELAAHIASEQEKESAIMKAHVKAHELKDKLKELAKKNPG